MALDDTKTLAERILRLEQKLQRLEKREGRPSVELFDNSAIRNRKIIDDLLVHNHTHANLSGLDADDHPQYLNTTRHDVTDRHTLGTVVPHDSHSSLSNLSNDDHTQYLNTTRHDTTIRHTLGTVVPHDSHSSLSNLSNDDHTQYTKHPKSSTDNAIVRWDGTGGRTLQNSSVAIDDNGKLSGDGLDGWIYDTDTWTYVSATSFKITGKDVRYRFPKGTKIKLVQSGSTKYFYVVATAYSADTTITITGGSDYALANEYISGQAYSYAENPQNYPFGTVAIRVERSTNQSIPNTAWTALSFDTIITEEKPATTSQWSSGSPTRLICRLPGYYLVNAHVRFAANATGARGINLMKNGVGVTANTIAAFSEQDPSIQCSAIVKLDTGDYVETLCYQNSGGGLNAVATSNNLYLEWIRLGI